MSKINTDTDITNEGNKMKYIDPYDFFIKMNLIINSHLAKDGGQVKLVDVVKEFFNNEN